VQYGYFDDDQKEYVITRPDTPRPWSNYLGSTEYGAIITNHAGGYSFYKSAAQGRFTRLLFNSIPMDQPGRYFYLRDHDSGDYWSASWQPVGKSLDQFHSVCRHGTAYTIIESAYAGIASVCTYFVPLGREYEVWWLRLTNTTQSVRRLGVFTFVEYANEWNVQHDQFNLQYSQYIVDCGCEEGVISHVMCPNLPADPEHFENRDQSRHSFFGLVGATPVGFDTDREAFLGSYRSYANPVVVERGSCTGSRAHGDNACGVLQVELTLAPGASREFMAIMGVGQAQSEGRAALSELDRVEKAQLALHELREHWHGKLDKMVVRTPDAEFDSMTNVWGAYNCLITFAWSRAASLVYSGERDGLGYRDTVQDLLGVLPLIGAEACPRLELMLTGQCESGGALPVVKPFSHRPGHEQPPRAEEYRADDCLWLFNTVVAYVKETGDTEFFRRVLPYADRGEATVLGHLRRAIEFSLEHSGPHGLPCGLSADWNDCLRLGERGESVFVAFQLRYALREYAQIAQLLQESAEGCWAQERLAVLDAAIQKYAWDGQWFVRAFRDDGSVVGGQAAAEGSLFLNAQSWAVLSGAATAEQARMAMDSVQRLLATEYGILLCYPPFRRSDVAVIRATLFNPGMKENGGIFCHPQGWAVMAETLLGRGDRAYAYYRASLPAAYNSRAESRQIEPYVHCQSTHGRDSRRFGASRLPWLTGAAAWSYVAATQHILGIRPDYAGLRVDPVMPAVWSGFELTRCFRGAKYQIRVHNPDRLQRGVRHLRLDGAEVDPTQPLRVASEGSIVNVEATLG
jgi:N,N'-diacetylchitobiose phosphorylase